MRYFSGLVLGLVLGSLPAAAAEDNDPGYIANPIWVTAPSEGSLPANPASSDQPGFVPLICRVQAGAMAACRAADPAVSAELLTAATNAAWGARIGASDADGRSTDGRDVLLFIGFPARPGAPAMQATPAAPDMLRWEERPSAERFDEYYPQAAQAADRSGRATIDCVVVSTHHILCTVTSEAPRGYGFGDAAIAISQYFRIADHTENGRPTVGARTTINLTFNRPR